MSTNKDMAPKKKFKIVKIEKGSVPPKKQKELLEKVFSNKDSYSAAKKAANAILGKTSKNKKMVKFIIENQKENKSGVKKQLAYTAYRSSEEKKEVEIKQDDGKKVVVKFTESPKVKSCLKTSV